LSLQGYESLVQSIDGIVWEAGGDPFAFTFVNKQAEKILGYPVKQWLTEPDFWVNHLHPVDREWAVDLCVNAAKRQEDHQLEYRMIAADGRTVWLRDAVTVSKADNGSNRLQGVMVDITDRVEAMNDLAASQMRTQLLLEQIPAVVWSTDLDLKFTHMAGRGLSLLQLPEGRDVGVSLHEYFQTDDPNFKPIDAHRRALSGQSLFYEIDWMGHIFDAYVEPLRNAVGEIVGCVGIALDITDRKRAEENILKQKDFTAAIMDSLPGAFYVFNEQGERLRWNKNFEKITGYSSEEIARMPILSNVAEEHKPLVKQAFEEVFAKGQSTVEADVISKDGSRVPYIISGTRES